MIRKGLVTAGLAMLGIGVVACSESVIVRSYPPGAKLYVNDRFAGLAPMIYTTPHSEIGNDFRIRLERDGYTPVDGVLHKRTCPGRIVGGIFTLGIVLAVRGPTCFVSPQDFSLDPIRGTGGRTEAERTSDGDSAHPLSIEERLHRIEKMRDEGTINQQEFEHYRKEIFKGL